MFSVINLSFVRFYRAPELLLGAREYGTEVDMWSLGCVLAELVILRPVLEGEDTGDQLASIVDILGVPSDEDLENMRVEDNMLAQAVRAAQVGFQKKSHPKKNVSPSTKNYREQHKPLS